MSDDALIAARRMAAGIHPPAAAAAVDARWEGTSEEGTFEIEFLGSPVTISWPALECTSSAPVPPHVAALLVYHLSRSDGSEPVGPWVSFAQLPDGGFYVRAFRGYTGALIAARFGSDPGKMAEALARVGAEPLEGVADRAWRVPALPRVPVALLWWEGDDEFEPRAELLFDASAPRHLPTDGCAVLGSWLTATILRG